ncbi:unnamed protein product [Rhizoctonia solani]|uniref:Uncharacterized protein n=1 Tax=Rhizoctonia solani TaxID=456999 RepID=A0A8H3DYU7_9AGAM|nr:unnamed protein product [Rhizoctonia solani]
MSNNNVRPSDTKKMTQFLVAEHKGDKATILRDPNYQRTLGYIREAFPASESATGIVLSAQLEQTGGLVQITEECWSDMLSSLMLIQVELDRSHWGTATVYVQGKARYYEVDFATETGNALKNKIFAKEGLLCHKQHLWIMSNNQGIPPILAVPDHLIVEYEGQRAMVARDPDYQKTMEYIKKAFTRIRTMEMRGRRIIVTAQLKEVEGVVRITSRSWSAVLPSLSRITVKVCISPYGQIFATGRKVAYLFWEAYTNPNRPLSPPTSRPSTPVEVPTIAFDPANPVLLPSQSALLPRDKVTAYIDDVLLALGLHAEARTSFITYWLPDLSKHAFIALRFLPQNEYEKAAPLTIAPAPDVTTRVFMLFGGIEESRIGEWDEAIVLANRDVTLWRDVVGVNIARAQDKSLFRVLEWGGMEVK